MAFLKNYPELTVASSKQGLRQVSLIELTDFYFYLKTAKKHFPTLSAEELIEELSTLMDRFDLTDFSAHFTTTLLTNPFDHKTDNLIAVCQRDSQERVQSLSIVGIDNDLAFAPSADSVRTILYLLKPMQMAFEPSIAERLIEMRPEGVVFDWLMALEEQNQRYERWKKQGVLTQEDLVEEGIPSLRIPLKIDARLIPTLYTKAQQLIRLLEDTPTITHQKLLEVIQPRLAQAYKKALETSDNLEKAYCNVPRSFPEEDHSIIDVHRSPEQLSEQLPEEAAIAFLKGLQLSSFP